MIAKTTLCCEDLPGVLVGYLGGNKDEDKVFIMIGRLGRALVKGLTGSQVGEWGLNRVNKQVSDGMLNDGMSITMVGRELYEAGVGEGFKEGIRKVGIEKRVKAGIRCGRRTREIVFEVEFVVDIIRKAAGEGEDSKWGKVGLGVMAEEGEDDWVNERFVQAVGKIA